MKKYKTEFTKDELHNALHSKNKEAEEILEDEGKWKKIKKKFYKLLKKINKIPVLGRYFEDIVCMVSLVDSYIKKEYKCIPIGTVVSILATILYVLSPIDLIPDFIPVIGYLDDAAIVFLVLSMGIDKDLNKYRSWQENNRKTAVSIFVVQLAEEIAEEIGGMYMAGIIVSDEMKMKLLLANSNEYVTPIECVIKDFNVPVDIFKMYGINTLKDIIESMNEMTKLDCINWVNEIEKKIYYEPEFEDKWDEYMIMEDN